MEIESTIKALQNIKRNLSADDLHKLEAQIDKLERMITRFFDKSSYYHQLLNQKSGIGWIIQSGDGVMGHHLTDVIRDTSIIVDNMVFELENFGIPSKQDEIKKHAVTINNSNTNNNNITQNQTLDTNSIRQVLKEELTGKQFNDVIQIIEAEPNPALAAPKLIDKIKSFGTDVASNVLANVLTNPNIYASIIG